MSADLAIDVRGLTKAFGGRTVVDHIDLAVPRGQVCGFLGPNGSGKTTTIRMLCGLLEVDAGEGTCLGYDIRREARRIKLRVGYMTQRFGLYEDLSIAREPRLHCARLSPRQPRSERWPRRSSASGSRAARRSSPERCPVAGSSAWRWRPACCTSPSCCCSTSRPPASIRRRGVTSGDEIHALAADGITVLVSTHYMDEAERCHRLVYISYGKMLAAGTAPEVIAQAGLRTWDVQGPRLDEALALVEQRGWMAVPFGTSLHVSSSDPEDFPRWLAERDPALAQALRIEPIATGLEDVFIALTQDARDTVS